jgi:Chromo (CHRromatin Organisation MOdifier) domain
LNLPEQWKIHNVFHTSLLTPYKETEEHGPNYEGQLPDLVEGQEEWEVEKVLDSQRQGRAKRLQYLLKWKGYPEAENTWQDKRHLRTTIDRRISQRTSHSYKNYKSTKRRVNGRRRGPSFHCSSYPSFLPTHTISHLCSPFTHSFAHLSSLHLSQHTRDPPRSPLDGRCVDK